MNRPDRPLDLDAIEARMTDPRYSYAYIGKEDVPALIAEVKRLRGVLGDCEPMPQPDHEHEWAYDRTICGFCNRSHGYCECGETEPCDTPQPDPLDENDHRDRRLDNGERLIRVDDYHWHTETYLDKPPVGCNRTHQDGCYALEWWEDRGVAFADDPQSPPQATSATETALNRAALAEVAEQAHRLSEAICDLLDGE